MKRVKANFANKALHRDPSSASHDATLKLLVKHGIRAANCWTIAVAAATLSKSLIASLLQ